MRRSPLRALAHPDRRRILLFVAAQERTAGEIVRLFSYSQPAVSKHLRMLRSAGLVRFRKQGRKRWYAAVPRATERTEAELRAWFEAFWEARLNALKNYLEDENAEPSSHDTAGTGHRKGGRGPHHA